MELDLFFRNGSRLFGFMRVFSALTGIDEINLDRIKERVRHFEIHDTV